MVVFTANAQQDSPAYSSFRSEQKKILSEIRSVSPDTSIVYPIARYVEFQVNHIHDYVSKDKSLTLDEKEKAIRSLVYLLTEMRRNLGLQKLDVYDLGNALESYRKVLNGLVYHTPWKKEFESMNPRHSQLMAAAFSQFDAFSYLDDMTVLKRVAASPEYILQYLESNPRFRYRDSLLVTLAAYDPLKIIYYLKKDNAVLSGVIRDSRSPYLQQLVMLAGEKNVSELAPFIRMMMQGKMTAEEVLAKRASVPGYYQLLVNSILAAREGKDSAMVLITPLQKAIRQKSLSFYVNQVNELHNEPDAVRFASVKDLRPEDLYYIITSAGDELYTSSYLGLYKRLKAHFRDQSFDELFEKVHYDNFHVFLRLAANYNVLADFLENMPEEKARAILSKFIAEIRNGSGEEVETAMDIADSFGALSEMPEYVGWMESELRKNREASTARHDYLDMRLYTILIQLCELVKQDGSLTRVWKALGNYELLERGTLEMGEKEIVELVLFYGDEDGVSSFNNFMRTYADKSKWEITKNQHWVSIRSLSQYPLVIYANLPLEIKEELDLRAQDSLFTFLEQQSLEPSIIVHRGHSYHLDKTLRRLKPSVSLAILGSCGGYNKAISIANINPDVHVIGSKKTGSKSINDPILEQINNTLVEGRDLHWPAIWDEMNRRFSREPGNLELFNEYFPPSHNLSLFVLKLFKGRAFTGG